MSIVAAVFFGFLLYSTSVSLKWFTIIRGFYLFLGIVEGLLIGELEARIVTRKLMRETESIAWQILPISAVLFGLPLLLAIAFFGVSEFLPFAAYLVLPFVPVYYATSGWHYNKFEKQNKVQIFMFVYGLKYWTEPILDAGDRFNQFVEAVASKDSSTIWGQVGYSKRLMMTLEERQDIGPSRREALNNILKTMNEYRRMGLAVLSMFIASVAVLLVFLFVSMFGLLRITDYVVVNIVGPASGCILFGFFISVWSLVKRFKKRISSMLASLDPDKLSSIPPPDEI